MRITDNRYAGELEKFELAMRMIGHEARTGTIRKFTGFTEDRIRKLVASYCQHGGAAGVRRRRGKSPRRIDHFVGNSWRQAEATTLAVLFVYSGATLLKAGECQPATSKSPVQIGLRLCQAYETYQGFRRKPGLSFEWAWSLYHSLVEREELYFARCDTCKAPYVQDRYALDYRRCPGCDILSTGNLTSKI